MLGRKDDDGRPDLEPLGENLGEAGRDPDHLPDLGLVVVVIARDRLGNVGARHVVKDHVQLLLIEALGQRLRLLHGEGVIDLDRMAGDRLQVVDVLTHHRLEIFGVALALNADAHRTRPLAHAVVAAAGIFAAEADDVEVAAVDLEQHRRVVGDGAQLVELVAHRRLCDPQRLRRTRDAAGRDHRHQQLQQAGTQV